MTLPRVFEKLHLNFGLHVEHHLFPSMSSHYAPLVRDELVRRWPERYQSLPLLTALGRLARTPRVYGSDSRLIDPRTGVEASTILPRPVAHPGRHHGQGATDRRACLRRARRRLAPPAATSPAPIP